MFNFDDEATQAPSTEEATPASEEETNETAA